MKKAAQKIAAIPTGDGFKSTHDALLVAEQRLVSHHARRDGIAARIAELEAESAGLAQQQAQALHTDNLAEADRIAARVRELSARVEDFRGMIAALAPAITDLECEAFAAEQRAEDAFRDAWLLIEAAAVNELKRVALPLALKGWRAAVAVGTTERPFDRWLAEQFSPGALAGFLPEGGAFATDIGIDLPERPPLCHYLTEERRRQIRMGATVNLSEVQS